MGSGLGPTKTQTTTGRWIVVTYELIAHRKHLEKLATKVCPVPRAVARWRNSADVVARQGELSRIGGRRLPVSANITLWFSAPRSATCCCRPAERGSYRYLRPDSGCPHRRLGLEALPCHSWYLGQDSIPALLSGEFKLEFLGPPDILPE